MLTVATALVSFFAIVPIVWSVPATTVGGAFREQGCSTDGLQFTSIPGQATFTPPMTAPSYIYAAAGVQNYTCNTSTNTFTPAGAVAELFDATCLLHIPGYTPASVVEYLYQLWTTTPQGITIQDVSKLIMETEPDLSAGQHYFIKNEGGGISPIWDGRASGSKTKGNLDAFVIGKVTSSVPAPTGPQDVNWLRLDGISGQLASTVFRTDTRGGQPPAQCTYSSETVSIKYASLYYLYGSSLS